MVRTTWRIVFPGLLFPRRKSPAVNEQSGVLYALIGLVLMMGIPCYGQVTSNVIRRVLLIQVGTSTGTAFTIDVDGKQYMITAKHVVARLQHDAETMINIRRKSGWQSYKVRVLKCDEPVDIAVLVPSEQLTVAYPFDATSNGLAYGQDAYFVGFPYGLISAVTYESLPDVFGQVKKATVSGFDAYPDKKAQRFRLDGYNNPGFSGSPLIFRDSSQDPYKVAGVVVGFIHEATRIVTKKEEIQPGDVRPEDLERGTVVLVITDGKYYRVEDTDQLVKLNTGIAIAWDIQSAIDLIRLHPTGPRSDPNFTGTETQPGTPSQTQR